MRVGAAELFAAACLAMPDAGDAEAQILEPVLSPYLATPLGPVAPYASRAKANLGRAIQDCLRPPLSPAFYRDHLHGDGAATTMSNPDDAAGYDLCKGYLAVASRHAKRRAGKG